MAKKKYIFINGIFIFAIILSVILFAYKANAYPAIKDFKGDITVYKSASCGCCGIYGTYFKNQGNSHTKILNSEDMDSIKVRYSVPLGLESCHTTVIGNYFVEGHVPLEAVNKLLEEKPDIAGIAMPGMPSGSPGMPGAKTGYFVIFAVNHNKSYEEFMRI